MPRLISSNAGQDVDIVPASGRDSCWEYGYATLAALEGSQEPIPTVEQFIAGLPKIVWPE